MRLVTELAGRASNSSKQLWGDGGGKMRMLGLYDPKKEEVALLGVVEHDLPVSELDQIVDQYETTSPPPRPRRDRYPFDPAEAENG